MYLFLILLSILNPPASIYDITLRTIDGKPANLSSYKSIPLLNAVKHRNLNSWKKSIKNTVTNLLL
jgi:hypothetical protein